MNESDSLGQARMERFGAAALSFERAETRKQRMEKTVGDSFLAGGAAMSIMQRTEVVDPAGDMRIGRDIEGARSFVKQMRAIEVQDAQRPPVSATPLVMRH